MSTIFNVNINFKSSAFFSMIEKIIKHKINDFCTIYIFVWKKKINEFLSHCINFFCTIKK